MDFKWPFWLKILLKLWMNNVGRGVGLRQEEQQDGVEHRRDEPVVGPVHGVGRDAGGLGGLQRHEDELLGDEDQRDLLQRVDGVGEGGELDSG